MLCNKPIIVGAHLYPCGQCVPCRINRRRVWQHRIMLEAGLYGDNAFVTLTYDDEHLPFGGNLVPKDVQLWVKKLRRKLNGKKVRYYCVGEYGDESFRPHYHFALFNFIGCARGRTKRDVRGRVDWQGCCASCRLVGDTWGNGDIEIGILEANSAGYLAGYVVKKMTRADDPRLEGRHPEFGRMSLRPGIAYDAMHELASTIMTHGLDNREVDVPVGLRHGPHIKPLGRYLRQSVRKMIGGDGKCPQEAYDVVQEKMRAVFESAKFDEADAPSQKQKYLAATSGRRTSIENRAKIHKQRRVL